MYDKFRSLFTYLKSWWAVGFVLDFYELKWRNLVFWFGQVYNKVFTVQQIHVNVLEYFYFHLYVQFI